MPRPVLPNEITDLEQLIDRCGLFNVLDALSKICYEKAEHIGSNWQDTALADHWSVFGGRLDTMGTAADTAGL